MRAALLNIAIAYTARALGVNGRSGQSALVAAWSPSMADEDGREVQPRNPGGRADRKMVDININPE